MVKVVALYLQDPGMRSRQIPSHHAHGSRNRSMASMLQGRADVIVLHPTLEWARERSGCSKARSTRGDEVGLLGYFMPSLPFDVDLSYNKDYNATLTCSTFMSTTHTFQNLTANIRA